MENLDANTNPIKASLVGNAEFFANSHPYKVKLVGGGGGLFEVKVVDELPEEGEKGTLYLIAQDRERPDIYDEYLFVDGEWERIGSTEIDLSDYVKKTDYATGSTGGVIKTAYTFQIDNAGTPYGRTISYNDYAGTTTSAFMSKGTLENVLNGRKYLMPEYTQTLPQTGAENKLYLVPTAEQPDVLKQTEGKDITLTDSSEGNLEWGEIKGETSQADNPTPTDPQEVKTVTGKNEIVVSGKNLAPVDTMPNNTVLDVNLKAGTTYTLSFRAVGTGGVNIKQNTGDGTTLFSFFAPNGLQTKTFTPAQDCKLFFNWYNMTEFPNNIQLELGSTATTYEPYRKQSVEVNLGNDVFDKNWLPETWNTSTLMQVKLNLKPNTTYTMYSTIPLAGSGPANMFFKLPEATSSTSANGVYDGRPVSITTGSDGKVTIVYRSVRSTAINRDDYTYQLIDSSVTPIELCKIGTHQDRIYKDSEGWKLHKEVGKKVLASTDTISSFNTHSNNYITANINDTTVAKVEDNTVWGVYSNVLKGTTLQKTWAGTELNSTSIAPNGNYIQVTVPINTATSADELRDYLVGKGATFYYWLATPTDTLITNSALIEQLENLNTLSTGQGYNLISTDTEHEAPTLRFRYYRPDPTVTKDEYIWVENHYEQLGGHRKFAHNLSVNHHTAQGHWQYSFQITTDTHTHFTHLYQIAKYISDNHAGLVLPISGTYTEGNDIYFITKLEGYSSSQVAIEMRKLSDGSLRRITTGAVDVLDFVS